MLMIDNDERHKILISLEDLVDNTVLVGVIVDGDNMTERPELIFEVKDSPAMYMLLEMLEIVYKRLKAEGN